MKTNKQQAGEHTQGEWFYTSDNEIKVRMKEGTPTIAKCDTSTYRQAANLLGGTIDKELTWLKDQANAKLIAAAPNMLEALKYALIRLPLKEREIVQAAIKKAE